MAFKDMLKLHPSIALFEGEVSLPNIPSCEHIAGSEDLILKSFHLQNTYGPIFDITCDCEDGAATGHEQAHAEMVARLIASDNNKYNQTGVRIHDPNHHHWQQDIDIILDGCSESVAYITIPKSTSAQKLDSVIQYIRVGCYKRDISRKIPVHAMIETHGALRDIWQIAALPWLRVIDFGQMDFVSAHNGAIPASAMESPGQFSHHLIVRAKTEIVAAALANGIIPSHNVCLNLDDSDVVFNDARRARNEFGFLRMWSIHPSQIDPIIKAMSPEFREIQDGTTILLKAQNADWGPIRFKGALHDRATYRYYWNILQAAVSSGIDIPKEAQLTFFSNRSHKD